MRKKLRLQGKKEEKLASPKQIRLRNEDMKSVKIRSKNSIGIYVVCGSCMELIATWKNPKTGSSLFSRFCCFGCNALFVSNEQHIRNGVFKWIYGILHASINSVQCAQIQFSRLEWKWTYLKRLKRWNWRDNVEWANYHILCHFFSFSSFLHTMLLLSFFCYFSTHKIYSFATLKAFCACMVTAWDFVFESWLKSPRRARSHFRPHFFTFSHFFLIRWNEWHVVFCAKETNGAKKNPIVAMKKAFFSHFC